MERGFEGLASKVQNKSTYTHDIPYCSILLRHHRACAFVRQDDALVARRRLSSSGHTNWIFVLMLDANDVVHYCALTALQLLLLLLSSLLSSQLLRLRNRVLSMSRGLCSATDPRESSET